MVDLLSSRREEMFPKLTPAQIGRLQVHGSKVRTQRGEVLAEPGDRFGRMLVVLAGSIEIVRQGLAGEELVVVHEVGQFTGEMSTLRGQGSVVRARVREPGEVLVL